MQILFASTRKTGHDCFMQSANNHVMWDRGELDLLLRLYGRHVARGEWLDYGIDGLKNMAVFSVFKRAYDVPLYRIEKSPALRRKQGMYALVNTHGHILKRGHELAQVLSVLTRKNMKLHK